MPRKERQHTYNTSQQEFGDSSNKTVITSAGRQTMAGTARARKTLWIPATDWFGIEPDQFANAYNVSITSATCTPTVRPFGMNFGSAAGSTVQMPVLSASAATNTDSRAAAIFIAPSDADTTGSVAVQLYYTTKVAMATAGSIEVWRLHYRYMGASGSPDLLPSGSILYGASMTTVGNGRMEIKSLGTIPSFNFSSSPLVALQLTLEQSNASAMSGSAEEQIFGLLLTYTACALGTASAE